MSTEEEIVSEIEETDQFCSHVELVLARLDEALAAIAPKIEASSHMSKEPTNEHEQSVSHVNILSSDLPQSQVHDAGPQIKLPMLVLRDSMEILQSGFHSGTPLRPQYIRTLS